MQSKDIDHWEWVFAFFRGSLELKGPLAAQAANFITGENRPEPDEDELVARLKPIIKETHGQICEECKAAAQKKGETCKWN